MSKVPGQRLHTECSTPRKIRFATQEAADAAVRRASFEMNKTLYTYDTCPCGWIHLTSKKSRVSEVPSITGLVAVGDEMFEKVVRDDVRKIAHPDDSAALRHPENLERWRRTLRHFQVELEKQLANKAGDRSQDAAEWRKRIQIVRLSTVDILDECRTLIDQQRRDNSAKNRPRREQRGEVGEIAVKRLIEAHQEEFDQYLIEEFEKAGVDLPKGLQQRIELRDLKGKQ